MKALRGLMLIKNINPKGLNLPLINPSTTIVISKSNETSPRSR